MDADDDDNYGDDNVDYDYGSIMILMMMVTMRIFIRRGKLVRRGYRLSWISHH